MSQVKRINYHNDIVIDDDDDDGENNEYDTITYSFTHMYVCIFVRCLFIHSLQHEFFCSGIV